MGSVCRKPLHRHSCERVSQCGAFGSKESETRGARAQRSRGLAGARGVEAIPPQGLSAPGSGSCRRRDLMQPSVTRHRSLNKQHRARAGASFWVDHQTRPHSHQSRVERVNADLRRSAAGQTREHGRAERVEGPHQSTDHAASNCRPPRRAPKPGRRLRRGHQQQSRFKRRGLAGGQVCPRGQSPTEHLPGPRSPGPGLVVHPGHRWARKRGACTTAKPTQGSEGSEVDGLV